jgi:tetrapyrrole methylase family protein/MazG family protein
MQSNKKDIEKKEKYDFFDLLTIMRMLRGENGCPWDKAQTHQSIRNNVIEEAYELVDAIDCNDTQNMIEEIGDLLLQCVFHCVIAEEKGSFDMDDVMNMLCRKLISRHSHIFGGDAAANAEEALSTWEKNKKEKYGIKTTGEYMTKIPKSMPALIYSEKIQKRAAKVGFDWNNIQSVYDKVYEEIEEVKTAQPTDIEEELGDLLFAVVNLCRFFNVEPEVALNKANQKFITRFNYIEQELLKLGKKPEDSNLEEMDKLWEQSKSNHK